MRIHTRPTVARVPIGMGGSKGIGDFDFSQLSADISAATTGTANIIKATETPYVIPGTNVIYNPSGAAVTTSAGTTATQIGTATQSWVLPAMLGGGVLLLVLLMGGRR